MIVAQTAEGYRFVTQPDHAAMVGSFADHWGNDAFEAFEPSLSVAIAAHVHDDGWWPRDRRPRLRDDGTPERFTEIPSTAWTGLYEEGIDAAVALDPYAGLLVSMHGSGLRRRRYGLSPDWPRTPPAYADFVANEETRQRALARDLAETPDGPVTEADLEVLESLHESGEPSTDVGSLLWHNYRLLQAWDALSLAFCTTVSPPASPAVGPVPTVDGDDVELEIRAREDGSFTMDPYPFDVDPFVTSVPTRTVRGETFDDESELVRAYYAAPREFETLAIGPTDR